MHTCNAGLRQFGKKLVVYLTARPPLKITPSGSGVTTEKKTPPSTERSNHKTLDLALCSMHIIHVGSLTGRISHPTSTGQPRNPRPHPVKHPTPLTATIHSIFATSHTRAIQSDEMEVQPEFHKDVHQRSYVRCSNDRVTRDDQERTWWDEPLVEFVR